MKIKLVSKTKGFPKTDKFLKKLNEMDFDKLLKTYAEQGLRSLRSATPVLSGATRDAWDYTISQNKEGARITYTNANVNQGFAVAIGIQYGHGTGTGGYVSGRDYINPAIRDSFDKMAEAIWEEVKNA